MYVGTRDVMQLEITVYVGNCIRFMHANYAERIISRKPILTLRQNRNLFNLFGASTFRV